MHKSKILLSILLIFTLTLPGTLGSQAATPSPTQPAAYIIDTTPDTSPTPEATATVYGKTTIGGLNVRATPSTKAKSLAMLRKSNVGLIILETETVSGATWYKIQSGSIEGYIHGDFVTLVTEEEHETLTPANNATRAPSSGGSGSSGSGSGSSSSGGGSTGPAGNGYVWIPRSGTKYHAYSSCSGMAGPSKVTREEAKSRGYTPCSKCY